MGTTRTILMHEAMRDTATITTATIGAENQEITDMGNMTVLLDRRCKPATKNTRKKRTEMRISGECDPLKKTERA